MCSSVYKNCGDVVSGWDGLMLGLGDLHGLFLP